VQAYLWVSLGAILGAGFRYFLSRYVAKVLSPTFPYGTLIINISGSLVLGFFLIWTTERVLADPRWRLLLPLAFADRLPPFPATPLRPSPTWSRASGT